MLFVIYVTDLTDNVVNIKSSSMEAGPSDQFVHIEQDTLFKVVPLPRLIGCLWALWAKEKCIL